MEPLNHHPVNTTAITLRSFLHASGISLALPFLDAMLTRSVRAAVVAKPPRRFIAVCGKEMDKFGSSTKAGVTGFET